MASPFKKPPSMTYKLPGVTWIGPQTAEVPVSRVSCAQLKEFLESRVPGQYEVEVMILRYPGHISSQNKLTSM